MPELPEVETTVRGLAQVLDGRRLARVTVRRPDMRRPFPDDLGQRLTGDPRCRMVYADFFDFLRTGGAAAGDEGLPQAYDAILVDIDHSPRCWLHADHASFYSSAGLRSSSTSSPGLALAERSWMPSRAGTTRLLKPPSS